MSIGGDALSALVSESGLIAVVCDLSATLRVDALAEPVAPEHELDGSINSSEKCDGDLASHSDTCSLSLSQPGDKSPGMASMHRSIVAACGDVIRRCGPAVVEKAEAARDTSAPTTRLLDVILSSLRAMGAVGVLSNAIWAASEYAKACGAGLLASGAPPPPPLSLSLTYSLTSTYADAVAILTACGQACSRTCREAQGETLTRENLAEAFKVL